LSQICGSSSIGTGSVVIIVVIVEAIIIIIIIIIISKSLRQYLSNILGKHEIKELQKKKNSRIEHFTTKSATVKLQNIFHRRNNDTCSRNCKCRTAAALYTLEIWFVSSI